MDRHQRDLEVLAWLQANLMNIHIPKGKGKVRAKDLLPRKKGQKPAAEDREVGIGPEDAKEAAKARARRGIEAQDRADFLNGAAGQRVAQLLAESDAEGESPDDAQEEEPETEL